MIAVLAVAAVLGWALAGLLGVRLGGVKSDRDAADRARNDQADELRKATAGYKDYRERATAQIEDLEHEIEELEELLRSGVGPDLRRQRLNRLLQKTRAASADIKRGMLLETPT